MLERTGDAFWNSKLGDIHDVLGEAIVFFENV